MSTIRAIKAREILDGRGVPTLEVILWLDDGRSVMTSAPTELDYHTEYAMPLVDRDNQEFNGLGVKKAIDQINQTIAPSLINQPTINQAEIDQFLIQQDGSKNKSHFGANAILTLSMAICKAGALSVGLPLYSYLQQKYQLTDYFAIPGCVYDLINGGKFGTDNLDFQEFQLIPASHLNLAQSLAMAATIKQKVKEVIENKGGSISTSLLGGYLPRMADNTDVFDLMLEGIRSTRYTFAQDVFFGLNANATQIASENSYHLRDKGDDYSAKEMLTYYQQLRELYKTIYLEEPFVASDHKYWQQLTKEMGETTKIVASDYLKGSPEKINQAIKDQTANTLIIKLLDRGTVTETMQNIKLAKNANWQVVIAQQSGETDETFLADLAVGVGANYVKFGPLNLGERMAKYNRLIRISEEITEA